MQESSLRGPSESGCSARGQLQPTWEPMNKLMSVRCSGRSAADVQTRRQLHAEIANSGDAIALPTAETAATQRLVERCSSCRCGPAQGGKRESKHGRNGWLKARQGKARQGKARQGKARQGKARQGKARQGKARQGKARQGKARQGKARQGKARQGKARQGKARQGKARQGKARQGKARQGKARQGKARRLRTGKPAAGRRGPGTCPRPTNRRGRTWNSRRTGCTRTGRPAWPGPPGFAGTPIRPCAKAVSEYVQVRGSM